jgi:hypothetical protein
MSNGSLKQHADYIARIKAKGHRTLAYTVPCCGGAMEDLAAPAGQVWDSLASCPYCGTLYMKVTSADAIEANTLGRIAA